ncbi:MAG: glucose-6-phosphate isomerase [Spirochaetales bacterium]|nr:glucose-6-phosphate isomerase [Spirochaetales bacterium]
MKTINYSNLDQAKAFSKLETMVADKKVPTLKSLLSSERVTSCSLPAGGGLTYNFAAKQADDEILKTLYALADEQQVLDKYEELLNGERINTGENRMVLHHLTRGQCGEPVIEGDKNLGDFYAEQAERFYAFSRDIHSGKIKGSTGKNFKTVVQIGIGGSDLGPRALYLALKGWAVKSDSLKMEAEFISNVDPDDASQVISEVDPESTLFILVSKSGTTQETLTNHQLVINKMIEAGIPGLKPELHMVAVTSQTSPLASSSDFLDSFYIDDYIGGRYSATSAVGGVILSLAFGDTAFKALLSGAHEADMLALESPSKNAALTDALLGFFENNLMGQSVTAILPYSQALSRFPAHLQQLDMESNGKMVNRTGAPLSYKTGPVIMGEPGTNGQHSFYQLLHQGTSIVPLQFIGFKESQRQEDVVIEGLTSQKKLNANLTAQIAAFALGQENKNKNKFFPGERPSSLIHGKDLNPKSLGALLAHFENKVMFQGFLWNLNSFDQEGVQLGKVLTGKVLGGADDPVLKAYSELLGI